MNEKADLCTGVVVALQPRNCAGWLGGVNLGGQLRERQFFPHQNLYGRTCSIPNTANHYRHNYLSSPAPISV